MVCCGLEYGYVACACEQSNEPSGSTKCRNFLTSRRGAGFSRRTVVHKDSVPQGQGSTRTGLHNDSAPKGQCSIRTVLHKDSAPQGQCSIRTVIHKDSVPQGQ